jgi:hypothetical protein
LLCGADLAWLESELLAISAMSHAMVAYLAAHSEQGELWAEWSKNHQGGFGALPPYSLAGDALLAGNVEEALRFADESLAAVGQVTMYLGFSTTRPWSSWTQAVRSPCARGGSNSRR